MDNKIQKAIDSETVVLKGNELPFNGDIIQFRKDVYKYAKAHIRGAYRNQDTGNLIEIRDSRNVGGLREILRHNSFEFEHLLSVLAIPDIIKNAVYIDSLPNEDTKIDSTYIDYYVSKLQIAGVDFVVKSVVVTLQCGIKYYDHKLTPYNLSALVDEIKKGLSAQPKSPKVISSRAIPSAPLEITGCKDIRLIQILQKNLMENSLSGAIENLNLNKIMKIDLSKYQMINEVFNSRLQDQIDGLLPDGFIYELGMPGSILRSTGFPYAPIELAASHLRDKSIDINHSFDLNDIKDLVLAIQDPIAIFKYGKEDKAQNVIVDLRKNGKNFLVGVHFNAYERNTIPISSIRGMFPKDNDEWYNWIMQNKALRLNKEKIQVLLDTYGINHHNHITLDLEDLTNKIKNFENSKIDGENLGGTTQSLALNKIWDKVQPIIDQMICIPDTEDKVNSNVLSMKRWVRRHYNFPHAEFEKLSQEEQDELWQDVYSYSRKKIQIGMLKAKAKAARNKLKLKKYLTF